MEKRESCARADGPNLPDARALNLALTRGAARIYVRTQPGHRVPTTCDGDGVAWGGDVIRRRVGIG